MICRKIIDALGLNKSAMVSEHAFKKNHISTVGMVVCISFVCCRCGDLSLRTRSKGYIRFGLSESDIMRNGRSDMGGRDAQRTGSEKQCDKCQGPRYLHCFSACQPVGHAMRLPAQNSTVRLSSHKTKQLSIKPKWVGITLQVTTRLS